MEEKMDRIEMNEETKALLTGLAPFSIKSTIDFTPATYMTKAKDADGNDTDEYLIPKELWPVITVRPWSRKESTESVKALLKFQNDTDDAQIRELVRKAVMGWDNLIDISSQELIPYEADADKGAKKELFESFPLTLVLDISHKIGNISGLNKSEKLGLK